MVKFLKTFNRNIRRRIFLWKNLCLEIMGYFIVFFKYGVVGNSIRIEASSICQLKCPECPQTKGKLEIIGKGYLKFEDFKKIVDNYPNFRNIELSNYGEMFLNLELKNIIKYAYEKNINLTAGNGVNLNAASEEMIRCLVKYRFKAITISIDGACNYTYKIYRRGGNSDRVIDNIKKINYYKRKYNTKFPRLTWQFIIFGHNEHELPIARKMAKELNMRFMAKFNWSSSYSPVKNKEFVRKKSGLKVASRQEYEQIFNKVYLMPCLQFWFEPQINWDGKLLGCCVNTWGDFGNVFESGLKKCLKSEKYVYIKKALLGKKRDRKDIPCIHCGNWEKIRSRPRHKKMQTLMIPLGLAEVNFLKLIIKNLKGRIKSVKSAIETKE